VESLNLLLELGLILFNDVNLFNEGLFQTFNFLDLNLFDNLNLLLKFNFFFLDETIFLKELLLKYSHLMLYNFRLLFGKRFTLILKLAYLFLLNCYLFIFLCDFLFKSGNLRGQVLDLLTFQV
jgi:hypothetical protein